jgi:phage terminase small subunit
MGGRGSGGKNRKPQAIKKAEGNRGKRKPKASVAAKVPQPLAGEPPMPAFITTPRLKAVWRMLVPILSEKGVLTKDCGIALGTLCSSYVHFSVADTDVAGREAEIRKAEGMMDALEQRIDLLNKRLGAAVRRRSDLLRHLRASYQAFGLDPSSSSGFYTADPKTPGQMKSRFDQILNSKRDEDEIVH